MSSPQQFTLPSSNNNHMSNFTVTRPGIVNNAGSATALFLKVFGGEVLTAFSETNVAMSRHKVRTITAGKSA